MSNNEEMAFNYMEVLVYHGFTRRRGVTKRKMKKKMEKLGFCNFTYVIVAVYFTIF